MSQRHSSWDQRKSLVVEVQVRKKLEGEAKKVADQIKRGGIYQRAQSKAEQDRGGHEQAAVRGQRPWRRSKQAHRSRRNACSLARQTELKHSAFDDFNEAANKKLLTLHAVSGLTVRSMGPVACAAKVLQLDRRKRSSRSQRRRSQRKEGSQLRTSEQQTRQP